MIISFMRSRNRTSSQIIGYGLYLYFLGLSVRNAAKALYFLHLLSKDKPCFYLELDTKVQTNENVQEEKECQ